MAITVAEGRGQAHFDQVERKRNGRADANVVLLDPLGRLERFDVHVVARAVGPVRLGEQDELLPRLRVNGGAGLPGPVRQVSRVTTRGRRRSSRCSCSPAAGGDAGRAPRRRGGRPEIVPPSNSPASAEARQPPAAEMARPCVNRAARTLSSRQRLGCRRREGDRIRPSREIDNGHGPIMSHSVVRQACPLARHRYPTRPKGRRSPPPPRERSIVPAGGTIVLERSSPAKSRSVRSWPCFRLRRDRFRRGGAGHPEERNRAGQPRFHVPGPLGSTSSVAVPAANASASCSPGTSTCVPATKQVRVSSPQPPALARPRAPARDGLDTAGGAPDADCPVDNPRGPLLRRQRAAGDRVITGVQTRKRRLFLPCRTR